MKTVFTFILISTFNLFFPYTGNSQKKKSIKNVAVPTITIVVFGPIQNDYIENIYGNNFDPKESKLPFLKHKKYDRIVFTHAAQMKTIIIDKENPFQYIPIFGKNQCEKSLTEMFDESIKKINLNEIENQLYVIRDKGKTYDCNQADNYPNIETDEIGNILEESRKKNKSVFLFDLNTYNQEFQNQILHQKEIKKTVISDEIVLQCLDCKENSKYTWYTENVEFSKKSEIKIFPGDNKCYSFVVEENGCQINSNKFYNTANWEAFDFNLKIYPSSDSSTKDTYPEYILISPTKTNFYAILFNENPDVEKVELLLGTENKGEKIYGTTSYSELLATNRIYSRKPTVKNEDEDDQSIESYIIKKNYPNKLLWKLDNIGNDYQEGDDIPKHELVLIFYPKDKNKDVRKVSQKVILNKCPIEPDSKLSE
jgi:hypothetical protein